jgi:TolB protein
MADLGRRWGEQSMRTHAAALCVLTTLLLAGCSSASHPSAAPSSSSNPAPTATSAAAAPEAQPAARGVESAADTIPWSQVGPGWVLATWSPVVGHGPGNVSPDDPDPGTVATTLYLVDPQGGRYPVTTFPPSTAGAPELIDWSGDKTRALFAERGPTNSATEVDLRTGRQTDIPLGASSASARYTMPDGKALLVTSGGYQEPKSMFRLDLIGNRQLTYSVGQDFGGVLSRQDGTELVVGTATGLALMGNDGTPGKALPVSGQTDCAPTRWWNTEATVVLASCGSHPSQLWLVPVDGGAPTALTAPNDGQSGSNLGDINAWKLPAGTFVQDLGACGVVYLAKLNPDGTTTEVDVPGVQAGTIVVVGVNGDSFRLQAKAACGGGIALVDYDPTTNTSTMLLGGPVNGGGVISAMAFKGER